MPDPVGVQIVPWSAGDLGLLQRMNLDPAMMAHVGGPESLARIAARQSRYERPDSRQFKIVDGATGEGVGWVGYWERTWREQPVYETGWGVMPPYQGRGLAGAAMLRLCAIARSERARRFMHAYPSVDNVRSNAVCRRLGFTLSGPCDFEYPEGQLMRCNDWRLDLFSTTSA
jgi:RimJ/RimL family protein N-acetyltransferase